jgi:hypothetical protein
MTTARDKAAAEEIAIAALSFIAGDAELLPRFLAITGISPSMIRGAASEPGFLAGVLNFVLAHEPTLLQFAEHAGIAPEKVVQALRALPTGDEAHERSV